MTTSHSQRISCPKPDCPNPTLVGKVSGVVASEEVSSTKTTLAIKLSLPEKPDQRGCEMAIFVVLFGSVGGYMLSLFISNYWFHITNNFWNGAISILLVLALIILMAMPLVALSGNIEREAAFIETLRPKWEQLYYCRSCDNVFLPGKPDFASADQMMEFLKSNQ